MSEHPEDPAQHNDLIGTIEVGQPADPADHGKLPTDAASGFGAPGAESHPGVVTGDD